MTTFDANFVFLQFFVNLGRQTTIFCINKHLGWQPDLMELRATKINNDIDNCEAIFIYEPVNYKN